MEDMWDIKRVLKSKGDTHNKVEVQANSESRSLTSSPTQSPGLLCLQISCRARSNSDLGDLHMHRKIMR
jgi:hypothetical protein